MVPTTYLSTYVSLYGRAPDALTFTHSSQITEPQTLFVGLCICRDMATRHAKLTEQLREEQTA